MAGSHLQTVPYHHFRLSQQGIAQNLAHRIEHVDNARLGQAVDDGRAIALGDDQMALAQDLQVARDSRLRHVEVGGQSVTTPQQVVEAVKSVHGSGAKSVLLLLQRNGQPTYEAIPFAAS